MRPVSFCDRPTSPYSPMSLCLRCEAKQISPTTPSSQADDLLSGRRRCSFTKYRGRLCVGKCFQTLTGAEGTMVPRVGIYGSNAYARRQKMRVWRWQQVPVIWLQPYAGQRTSKKLAVNSVEDECHHVEPPCLTGAIGSRNSFQADFAAQRKWFRRGLGPVGLRTQSG